MHKGRFVEKVAYFERTKIKLYHTIYRKVKAAIKQSQYISQEFTYLSDL